MLMIDGKYMFVFCLEDVVLIEIGFFIIMIDLVELIGWECILWFILGNE